MKSSRYSVRKHVVIRRHSVLNVAFNWIAIGNIGLRRTPFKVLINHMCRYTYHSIRTFRLCVNHLVHSINSATFNVHVCWIVLIYFNFLWHLMQSNFSFRTFFHRDFHDDDSWMEILWKLWNHILSCVTFRWLERSGICAYPNQIVELAEPVVEQFIWVVRTMCHFVAHDVES